MLTDEERAVNARIQARRYYARHREALLEARKAKRAAAGAQPRKQYATAAERGLARLYAARDYYRTHKADILYDRLILGAFIAHCGGFQEIAQCVLPIHCPQCGTLLLGYTKDTR